MKAAKIRQRLRDRIKSYGESAKGTKFPHVNDSPNRNQQMHKPGSQNRKK